MSIEKNIILKPNIIQDEISAVELALTRLQIYARAIPVAHYHKDVNDPLGRYLIELDQTGDFFRESYSDMLINNKNTGKELAKMLKLFCSQKTKNSSAAENTLKNAWRWFTYPVPDSLSESATIDTYNNFIKGQTNLLDHFTKAVDLFLRDVDLSSSSENKFAYTSEYFEKPFRDNASMDEYNYLLSRDVKTQNLIRTLSSIRNKKEHYDNSIFSEPSNPIDKFEYCKNIHCSFNFYMLLIIDRFFEEFWDKLVVDDRLKVNCSSSDLKEKLHGMSKQLIKLFYIDRVHKTAEKKMRSLFHGTGIHDKENLLSDIPEILLKGKDENNNEVIGDCVDMLVENQACKRRLIIGEPGSGKSVMFTRMLQRDQPMVTPFYFELKEFYLNDSTTKEVVSHMNHIIEKSVIHEENIIINKGVKNATIERIYELLNNGSVVFFIDSVDAARQNIPNLMEFINTYPECQYIIGTQPDAVPLELINAGFSTFEIMPLNDAQIKKMMKITSLHLNNIDHTSLLQSKIRHFAEDLSKNPFTLMQIIYLLESSKNDITDIENRSQLYWEIFTKIQKSDNLEAQEKTELMSRSFLVKFLEQLDSVTQLCSNVMEQFNSTPQGEWKKMILEYPVIIEKKPAALKTMFEMMGIIRFRKPHLKHQSIIFTTLATSAVLESGITKNNDVNKLTFDGSTYTLSLTRNGKIPMPNPLLKVIARATSAIALVTPEEADYQKSTSDNQKVMIVYRLQPKFIIRQYIMTLMNVYKDAGVNIKNHNEQLIELFYCIAYSGDCLLIDKIFTPYWMEKWLMQEEDFIDSLGINGSANKMSKLPQILTKDCVNLSYFAYKLLQQYPWITTWNMIATKHMWRKMLRDIIVYEMNDEQRETLFYKMDNNLEKLIGEDNVSYYRNMLIISMDNIWLADKYNHNKSQAYELELQNRLMMHGDNTAAINILISWISSLFEKKDTQNLERIFMHLMKHMSTMHETQKDKLWEILSKHISIDKPLVRYLTNRISIELINPKIAESIYDKRIYRHLLNIKKKELEKLDVWKDYDMNNFQKNLYLDSTKLHNGCRFESKFTFYSQNNSNTMTLATECVDEMVEHRFCKIKNYDQWFYVENVIVLGKEKNLDYIAELTLNLPDNLVRPRKGYVTLSDGKHVPYIHMFQIRSSRQVVVRVDDQECIKWLMEENRIDFLKENNNVLINDVNVRLVGVNIRKINPNMRLIVIKAVNGPADKKEYKNITPTPLKDDVPHSGYISFYNNKDPHNTNSKLQLKILANENVARKTAIKDCVYLGSFEKKHYIISDVSVSKGHILVWSKSPFAGTVTEVIQMFGQNSNSIPKNILERYHAFFFNYKQALKKEGLPLKNLYNGTFSIIEMEILTNNRTDLYSPGKKITEHINIRFYHPIANPDPLLWRPKKYAIELESCAGVVTKVDNTLVLELPKTTYPPTLSYFTADVLPKKMPLKWYHPTVKSEKFVYIKLDNTIKALFKENVTHSVKFYTDIHNEETMPIHFDGLTDLIDISKPQKYHPDITPILISEWISDNDVDYRKLNFCSKKKYDDLLKQQCQYYNVTIKEEKPIQ